MELSDFINDFAQEFEVVEPLEIKPESVIRDLEGWDSFVGLSIIGMIHNKYHIKVTGDDLKACKTVQDLYDLVLTRK